MSASRPSYGPLRRDQTGRRHLVVADPAGADAELNAFLAQEPAEVWRVSANGVGAHVFPTSDALLAALEARLTSETMGLRLYARGEEAFLWDVNGAAQRAGMGRREVVLSRVGGPHRRVICVHCGAVSQDVARDLVVCPGCGLSLSVRDHYSRRLGAYMGVNADAEAPGELPEAREFSA